MRRVIRTEAGPRDLDDELLGAQIKIQQLRKQLEKAEKRLENLQAEIVDYDRRNGRV